MKQLKEINLLMINEPLHGLNVFKEFIQKGVIKGLPGLYYLLNNMLKNKWKVHLLVRTSQKIESSFFETLMIYNSHSKSSFLSKTFWGQVAQALYRGHKIMKNNYIEVIYGGTPFGATVGYFLSRIHRIPLIVRIYGSPLYAYHRKNKLEMLLNRHKSMMPFLVKADAYIITQDGTFVEILAELFKLPKSRTFIWLNGYDQKLFEKSNCNEILREFFDSTPAIKKFISKHDKHIFWVGRIEGWKRPHRAIEFMEKLSAINKKVGMVMVGDGREINYIKHLIARNSLGEAIFLAGRLDRQTLLCLLRNYCDIYVSFYDMSNFSTSLVEAMISGCLPFVLNKGNMEVIIKNYNNGILVDEENLNDAHLLMNKILENEDFIKKIQKNAKYWIKRNFLTWEERIKKEMNLIYKIAREKKEN